MADNYSSRKDGVKMDYISVEELSEQKVNDYLTHYGVKGMRWGHHKKKEEPTSTLIYTKKKESDTKIEPMSEEVRQQVERRKKKQAESRSSGTSIGSDKKPSATTSPKEEKPAQTKTSEQIKEEQQKYEERWLKSQIFAAEEKTRKLADSKELSDQVRERISKQYQDGYYISNVNLETNTVSFAKGLPVKKLKKEPFSTMEMEAIKRVYDSLSQSAFDGELYLSHYGIEGQKWGVRNGPPYPLDSKGGKSGKVTINIKNLSDEDLNRIINRIKMEKQLKELTSSEKKKTENWVLRIGKRAFSTGENVIFKALDTVLTKKATQVLSDKLGVE